MLNSTSKLDSWLQVEIFDACWKNHKYISKIYYIKGEIIIKGSAETLPIATTTLKNLGLFVKVEDINQVSFSKKQTKST